MSGGLKVTVECPNCKSSINYNRKSFQKNLTKDGLLKCKVIWCRHSFSKKQTEIVYGYLFIECIGKTPKEIEK